MTVWLLGDQLNPNAAPLQHHDHVLMIEAHGFAERMPYHPQKLTLVFSAMRHLRDDLRADGYDVTYLEAESFGDGLDRYFEARPGDSLVLQRPASHGAGDRLREMVEERGGDCTLVANDGFLTTPADWEAWVASRGESAAGGDGTSDGGTYRQEHWYRHVRRETGILLDDEGDPVGGEWNYDDENRETPPGDWSPPPVPEFEPDAITREVHEFVVDRYDQRWGSADLADFRWPVTREEALQALEQFVAVRLPEFGPYQDAMVEGEWALDHSLLSPAINLGLLHPREVVDAAVDAYRAGREDGAAGDSPAIPLNSVEGFVRQVVGWREFMRHVYRESMPGMDETNQLGQTEPLPEAYWTGETDMTCLSEAVGHVREHGYAHHIERLMVLSNFALIYGVDPGELNRWFHLGFVDAFHWVTTPNVVGMGSFATDALSSKPYASSANYVNRMSDYCSSCPYHHTKTTGEGSCPFNALYWDFLKENEGTLRGTGRMGLMYSHVDDKNDEEWAAIEERAAEIREMGKEGTL
ncbi:cryptochrome/photolyase family protein [Halobaculum roseum]|uniref:Cryptochrome/photolyase family protein n=1 Tax=Halobaculum roseum TaxID=2175149 RepID=A0ABD5MQA0_9EURY|nr:cryptochrome/photolyase family protein [Halobaculum roseum]QZY03674.1 cryptochrome/photolyase family protein [Halobaculum roseum]